jgi:hypothetical protein
MQTVDEIDYRSGGIVNFEIRVNQINFHEGNFERISNDMEIARFRRLLLRRFHNSNVRQAVTNKDSKLRHKIMNSGSHVKHRINANHALKMLERFCDFVADVDKKHLFGFRDLLKPLLIHVVYQEIPVGQQIFAWKIITVMIILLVSIRIALSVIGAEIIR